MTAIPFAKTVPNAKAPTIKYEHDAGMDFYSLYGAKIPPHGQWIVSTGIKVEIPPGFVGLLKPKGSQRELVGSGVIEWTYTGEIIFRIVNASPFEDIIEPGDPVGQMIIVSNLTPEPVEVDPEVIHLRSTDRGTKGGIVEAHVQQDPTTHLDLLDAGPQ